MSCSKQSAGAVTSPIRDFFRAVAISIGLAAALVGAPVKAALNAPVKTEAGWVAGVSGREAAVTTFKGIPYAAPPVGELRWRDPQPAPAWQGVRMADQFGSECLQTEGDGRVHGSEDCLFLNVWTGASSAGERRPVMVWSYNDGFRGNDSANPLFDAEGLARKGVVVVSSNYRAGVFGFLATPDLSKESGHNSSGNYGMLDQIAVLKWVQKNIAAFGGDPDRVTVMGQSAGGLTTLILLQSPLTKGLFHSAIIQSRATGVRTSLEEAERQGVEYMTSRGARSLKELRAMPWQKLKEKDPYDRPLVDGYVIAKDFHRMYVDGVLDVPLIMGNTRDESGAMPQPTVTLRQFQDQAMRRYGARTEAFMKLYPATTDQEAGQAKNAAAREDSRMQTYLMVTQGKQPRRTKAYTYFWTHAPPGPNGARLGAHHSSEINYVFNNLYAMNLPWTDEDRRIADVMSSYWANFAATGNPNGKGLPEWPAVDDSTAVMELGDNFGTMPPIEPTRAEFIKQFYQAQPTAGRWR